MIYKKENYTLTDSIYTHFPIVYKCHRDVPIQIIVSDHDIEIVVYVDYDQRLLKPYANRPRTNKSSNRRRRANKKDSNSNSKDASDEPKPYVDKLLETKDKNFTYADAIEEGITKNWGKIYKPSWYAHEKSNEVPINVRFVRKPEIVHKSFVLSKSYDHRYVKIKPGRDKARSSFVISPWWRWVWGLISYNKSLESFSLNWSPYFPGTMHLKRYTSLANYEQVAAHEFGHLLGIGDAYAAWYRGYYQAPNTSNYMMCYNREVSDEEIEMVLTAHLTERMQFFPSKVSIRSLLTAIKRGLIR